MDLDGKNVVVTGVIPGESRVTAEGKLRDAGANVQRAVSATTDLLVTGGKVGKSKTTKAAQLGVEVAPWASVWSNGATSPPASGTESLREGAEALEAARRQFGRARGAALPSERQIGPMLCKDEKIVPPNDAGRWQFEIKWDGYRGLAVVRDGAVKLQSRSGLSEYTGFPQVVESLSGLPDCVLDGELVVLDGEGCSSFESMGKGVGTFVVYDCLEAHGEDVRQRPLRERVLLVDVLTEAAGPAVTASPRFEDGERLLEVARARGYEGIVAKLLSGPYREGYRGGEWLKIKLRGAQEFVVVGWTPGKGGREGGIGALLLAVNEDTPEGRILRFVGKAGSGGDTDWWDSLAARLTPDERPTDLAPFKMGGPELASVTWVEPEVVVQVAFQRWTEDGILWHPSVVGLRDDKSVREVVREVMA